MKTSQTDPIRVDFLAADDLRLPGRIGLTLAPGKKDAARSWDRDLAIDLDRLTGEYGARLLVSLMEKSELRMLHVPELLDRAAAAGIETIWFPIRDLDAPRPEEMPEFVAVVRRILTAARQGRTVVIHCRGGVGRSGLVAAACLVARGHAPSAAIDRVRAVRANAVETESQERWVESFAGCWPEVEPRLDAFLGCLLGGAVGDALGYPVEFTGGDEIVRRYGTSPPAALSYGGGSLALVSDDTQMTLFTAEGLIRARQAGAAEQVGIVAHALLRWYSTQGGRPARRMPAAGWLVAEERLHHRRAPGNTCMSALATLARETAPWPTVAKPPNDSKGCGAVMRAAPCGLFAASRETAFALGRDTGVLTHGHPSGYLSAAYLAATVWDLARGSSLAEAMDRADDLLAPEGGSLELTRILARTRKLAAAGPPDRRAVESLGEGWTGEEALAIALLCALTFDGSAARGIEDALWRAAAHSGDSDSTAAIAGNLIGARAGGAALPGAWLSALELRDVVERIARDLCSAAAGETPDAYPAS